MTVVNGAAASQILDGPGLARTIRRLAHEVSEAHQNLDRVVVAAIREGGVPVARALVAALRGLCGVQVPLVAIDVGDYRDDRPRPQIHGPGSMTALTGAVPSVEGAVVLVVDDVIHTGRTLRAALDLLASHGRPAGVELLVLIDRGRRELPIKASFVGKNIPASQREWVQVVMSGPVEPGVFLVKRP